MFQLSSIVLLGLVCVVGVLVYRAALPQPLPGIPYHKKSASRVLGDIPDMIRHRRKYGTFHDWVVLQGDELNSPVFQLFLAPFGKPFIYVTDPRETQDVLMRRGKEFDRSKFFMDVFAGTVPNHHIMQLTNAKFKQGVRLVADTMATPFLHGVAAPITHKHALGLMDLWRVKSNASRGRAFPAAEDLILFSFDSIWETAFGNELDALINETKFVTKTSSHLEIPASKDHPVVFPKAKPSEAIATMAVVALGINVTVPSMMPRFAHWRLRQTYKYRYSRKYNDELVRQRLEDSKSRLVHSTTDGDDSLKEITCATDLMVRRETQAARKESRTPQYDSLEAKDELFGFLVGGFDTTATAMKWSVKFMADHPRVQNKLRRILRDAFGKDTGIPTSEQLTSTRIPYLDAVVEELLRCGQTASSAIRTSQVDTQLLGYHIPKGYNVFFLSNGSGYMASNSLNDQIPEHVRSPSSRESKDRGMGRWDDEDISEFKPERWLKVDENGVEVFDPRAGPSMQFGLGVRACFGKKLVYMQFRIAMAVLTCSFDLQPLPMKLGGYQAYESLARRPVNCYVKLEPL